MRRCSFRFLFAVLVAALIAGPVWAQQGSGGGTVTVSGTVTVDSESPAAAALADAASATPTTVTVGCIPSVMNATTEDRQRGVVAALDSVGTGIAAAGLVGQLDDTSPAAVTENQFAPARLSPRRSVLVESYTGADPCATTIAKSSVAISATSNTELVAASGSLVIYVCGWSFGLSGTTTPTARLVRGTGTVCATGKAALTGLYLSAATAILITSHGGNGTQVKTAASDALCIEVDGTAPSAVGYLSFVQQ